LDTAAESGYQRVLPGLKLSMAGREVVERGEEWREQTTALCP